MKKPIDIEKLVQWAMRDELPKGQAVASSPWQLLMQFAALGVRIQTGGYQGDGFGFTPGAPHEDAIIVADAIRALDTKAKFAQAAEVEPLFGDLVAIAGDAIPSIMMASFDPRSLVISHATMGTRPKWKFETPTPYQMFMPSMGGRPRAVVQGVDADGDVVELKQNRGRAAQRDGVYSFAFAPRSPLNWHDPSMVHIGECRAEYIAWHSALAMLARDLAGKLAEHEPLATMAPALPWITGEPLISRVIEGRNLGDVDVGMPLTPRRRAAGKPIESPIEAETRASYNLASRTKRRKEAVA